MGERVSPQDLGAEIAVLGAVLIGDEETVDQARGILVPECFYDPRHRHVFSAMCSLADHNRPVDQITVMDELRRIGKLEGAGGASAIAELAGEMATPANVEHHAKIVADAHLRRVLINRASQLAVRCYSPSEDIESLLNAATDICPDLRRSQAETWEPVGRAVERAFDAVEAAWKAPGVLGGVPTGLADLDDMLNGLQPSDLVLVAARPSVGKTALALHMAWAASEKAPVALVSAEMSNSALGGKFLAREGNVDSQAMRRGRLVADDYAQLQSAEKEIGTRPIYLSEILREPGEIGRQVRRLRREKHIGLVIVDYLQLLDAPPAKRADNREREVAAISRALKAIAMDLHIPVVALAQLNRKAEDRADKRPQLSDLRDSGSLEQDSDVVILLHRPARYSVEEIRGEDVTHLIEANVAKQRNGPTGTVRLYFEDKTGMFGNWRK